MAYISGKERLKFFFLIFLVLISVIQVGILWNYQAHGLPINALWGFFTNEEKTVQNDIKQYFEPARIVVSEGFDEPRWVLDKSNDKFDLLWREAKNYLQYIIKSENVVSSSNYSDEQWSDLVVKRGIVFEFQYPISIELVNAFLDINPENSSEIKAILKMIILPFEDVNNRLSIYIYDGEKIFNFSQKVSTNGLGKIQYDEIIQSFDKEQNLRKYSVVKEVIPNGEKALFKISPDIPVIVGGSRYNNFLSAQGQIPENIIIGNISKNIDLERIARNILGNKKDEYDLGVDTYGSVVFKNLNDIYRIHKEGVLEYRSLYDIENFEEVDESTAFDKVVQFFNNELGLVKGNNRLCLTGSKKIKDKNCFEFTFDYYVNDMPVLFNGFQVKSKDTIPLTNAITICANNKNVVSCMWIIRQFNVLNKVSEYNVLFEDLLEDVFKTNQNIDHDKFSIGDIKIIYEIKPTLGISKLTPSWLVRTIDEKWYVVPMRERKEE